MIPVTKPYLPDINKYFEYINKCYLNQQLTNNGPLVKELKKRLENHLGVKYLLPVANGTLALQIAYKTLGISEKVITTPFTFIATSSSLQWEGIKPIYADIDPDSLNLSPEKVELALRPDVSAILPVHVYGNPCDVEAFDEIANNNNLKVIYDGAHAFDVRLHGRSVLEWGDASILSFHATKVFHTVEGGAVIFKEQEDYERACRLINFGYEDRKLLDVGINAKMSEFHAAMGLCVLDELDTVYNKRKLIHDVYQNELCSLLQMPKWREGATRNYSYFPVLFSSEYALLRCQKILNEADIYPRRYFYPSLDEIFKVQDFDCPVSRDIGRRVLCLPTYPSLSQNDQFDIINLICSQIRRNHMVSD
ncbi:MAG: DegT/DnrJ/EryC1/StrS family aminotransferase [Eubacteriales bacterium]